MAKKRAIPGRKRTSKETTRSETKAATREALIASAVTLFAERGFDAPSLDDICEHAGYTRGAFYVHFRDRDDLVRAAMASVGPRFLDALFAGGGAGESAGGLADLAQRFVASFAGGSYPFSRRGGMRPHQLLDACARSPEIRAQYVALVGESVARVAQLARDGQTQGALRDDVPAPDVGLIVVCAVIGAQTLLDLDVKMDLPNATASLLSLFGAR